MDSSIIGEFTEAVGPEHVLTEAVGPEHVLTEPTDLRTYECAD